jgi:hypothetical protein
VLRLPAEAWATRLRRDLFASVSEADVPMNLEKYIS